MDTEAVPLTNSVKLEDLLSIRESNLLTYSEDITNTVWENFYGTKRSYVTNILDPFGQTYVRSISGSASIHQNIFFNKYNSVDQYVFSFYVHQNSTAQSIVPYALFTEANVDSSIGFSPQTGECNYFSFNKTPLTPDCFASENVGNGWYKYYLAVSQISALDLNIKFGVYYNGPTIDDAPWNKSIIFWGAQLNKGNISKKYFKTLSTPKASVLEEGFVNLKTAEPSLGLPNIKNLLTNSQSFSSSNWKSNNLILSANDPQFLSPVSSFDVFKLIPTTTTGFHYITQTVSLPNTGIPYTFSGYFREDKNYNLAYRYVSLMTCSSSASANNYFRAQFNLDDGSLVAYDGKNISLSSYSITPSFSGWYRFSITTNLNYNKDILCQIYVGQHSLLTLNFAGDENRHIYAWGTQLEKGTLISDYIKSGNSPKTGITYSNVWSSTNSNSAYYFALASPSRTYDNSRRFTGNDSFFLSGKNLSYNCKSPRHDFDISGSLHSLSAYFNKLSTNNFKGSALNFNNFDYINFNSQVRLNKISNFDYLSAQKVTFSSLSSLSTAYFFNEVPSISANFVFSSINWNVTAVGYLSANRINTNSAYAPFLSSNNSFFRNLTSNYFTAYKNVCAISSVSAEYVHGLIEYDAEHFYYNSENLLTTRLSAAYFLGIKPSDPNSTDDISLVRSISGAWDGSGGTIIETFPVLKPYFKNIRQALKYVEKRGLYGEELNILVYDDISQNNINVDNTFSESGCEYHGNINARYYNLANVPTFLKDVGFKAGDYVWNRHNYSETTGKISYWGVDRLDFSNINFYGMYEIGTLINFNAKKLYTNIKPYDQSPRKIFFRTYVCANTSLPVGSFGSDVSDWQVMYHKSDSKINFRPIQFNNDEMDVNIHNLCFEFDTNANDCTCLYFKSGNSYLSNVTVAALGLGNYQYGAILAWPKSTIYVCGENQIDPYLLSPSRWNNWNTLPTATNQNYFPGYGLAIVGNSTTSTNPTFFSDAFIQAWRSRIYFMDFQANRRVGRYAYHNSSIILDGKFTANSFYALKDHSKIYASNHVFRTANFYLSNLNCTYFTSPDDLPYINTFSVNNRDNFYYLDFQESNSFFIPHNLPLNHWTFKDNVDVLGLPISGICFTSKLINDQNPNYIFETANINLSGMVFGDFQKNSLGVTNLAITNLNSNALFYNYIDPNNLGYYSLSGLYYLSTPITNGVNYTLNYYS
jgi:hypothetical protein